ncbi:MAG: serine hydrolase [Armatimonadota bacterium]|nr:class A beta-lactamase-related serine hydrolase [bacterium]MDW8321177.1 serine hydrolase [Armatimonadota bacterium]
MQHDLLHELSEKVHSVPAEVGLAVRGVDIDVQLDINSTQTFRSASIIKVPLLAALFWLNEQGALDWHEMMPLHNSVRTPGSGILRELHTGLELTLRDLAVLMIVLSDNTATNMLIDRVGVERVQQFLKLLGFCHTTLQRKMYDFAAAEQGRENLCCASEIADLLKWMAQGAIRATDGAMLVSDAGCEQMLEIMREQFYRDQIPALLPDEAKVANKTGEISGHHHDSAVIWTPAGCYTLVVLTRGFEHRRLAAPFIAELSLTVYETICHHRQDSSR